MIVAKMHRREGEALLAACDKKLLGSTLKEEKMKVSISEGFFGSEIVEKEDLALLMSQSTTMNLFGEKTISIALAEGYVDEDSIITIAGIPHAQIYFI